MASGMQTIANQGLHHDPYYVDYIDRSDGTRLYTHDDPGVQVLDPDVALTEVAVLEGSVDQRHGPSIVGRIPVPGGRQDRHADLQHQLVVRRLDTGVDDCGVGRRSGCLHAHGLRGQDQRRSNVQHTRVRRRRRHQGGAGRYVPGGGSGGRSWSPLFAALPLEDWAAPPAPERKPVRLYLPGNECLAKLVTGALPTAGGSTTTSTSTLPPDPEGSTPPTTAAPKPVLKVIPSDTTIPPDVVDPKAPFPTVPISGTIVYACDKPPSGVIITGKKSQATTTTQSP